MNENRYCLVSDQDTHSYIIPFDKRSDWEMWLAEWDEFEEIFFNGYGDGEPVEEPVLPEWATYIDGEHISFTNWKIEK